MRNLKLNLEDLSVESFATSAAAIERGTVAAHASNEDTFCNTYCQTEAYRLTCAGAECTGGSGASDDTFCPSAASCPGACGGTYEHTCYGHTRCGTCAPVATCDLQYGCSGNSLDMQPC